MLTKVSSNYISSYSRFFTRGFNAFKNDGDYKEKAADAMFELADKLTQKYESKGDDFIITAQDDQVNITTPNNTMLVSRQTPSHQIWVSSPVSGSLKFDYDSDLNKWFNHKLPLEEFSHRVISDIDKMEKLV